MEISVVILARNEEKNIARAVDSTGTIGAVTVIDSGSSDATVEIAEKHGANVITNPWPGFAAQRNFAIEKIKSPWIFFLDADEEITPELAAEIKTLTPQHDGYRVPRRSLFLGRWMEHGAWGRDSVLRLFRRENGHVPERLVHEEVSVNGPIGTLMHPILHYAQNDFETIGRKFTDYVPLMAEEINRQGKSTSVPAMILRAKSSFFRDYFLRRGFLDGWQGFVLACWSSISVIAKYAEARRIRESDR